jgi:outer membrane cobalamin receptor
MTKRNTLAAGTAFLGLVVAAQPALADEAGQNNSASDQTIVVTATRDASPLASVPVSISVVTADRIKDQPGRELDDVLRTLPGIDLMSYSANSQHPTSNSLGMRGLGGGAQGISRALVMVDGIPINDGYFGYVQWNRFPLDAIAQVEVVRGGGSPLWGNYAEGGVINVVTADPKGNVLTLDACGGSYGAYRASASAAYHTSATNVLQAFFEANGEAGYQAVPAYERVPFNVPTSSHAINARLKDSVELPGDLTADLTVNYHNNSQQLQTVLDSNTQRNIDVSANVAKKFSAEAKLALSLFYGNSHFSTNNSTYFPIHSGQTNISSISSAMFCQGVYWQPHCSGWLQSSRGGSAAFSTAMRAPSSLVA